MGKALNMPIDWVKCWSCGHVMHTDPAPDACTQCGDPDHLMTEDEEDCYP